MINITSGEFHPFTLLVYKLTVSWLTYCDYLLIIRSARKKIVEYVVTCVREKNLIEI